MISEGMTSGGDDAAAPSGERVAAALKVERPAGHKARAGIRLSVPGGRRSARGASEGLAAARQESEERESGGRGRMMQLGWGTDGRGCGACSVRRRNSPVRRRVLASRVRRRQSGSPGAGGRDDQQPNRHCHSRRRHGPAGPAQQRRPAAAVRAWSGFGDVQQGSGLEEWPLRAVLLRARRRIASGGEGNADGPGAALGRLRAVLVTPALHAFPLSWLRSPAPRCTLI